MSCLMVHRRMYYNELSKSLKKCWWNVIQSFSLPISGAPPWSSSSVLDLVCSALDHRSLPPVFESRHDDIWRLFHLWLCFITFAGHSAHLADHVHKSSHKTTIIISPSILHRRIPKFGVHIISKTQLFCITQKSGSKLYLDLSPDCCCYSCGRSP